MDTSTNNVYVIVGLCVMCMFVIYGVIVDHIFIHKHRYRRMNM